MNATAVVPNCITNPGSLAWETCFAELAKTDRLFRIAIRRAAADVLALQTGVYEIGSSDINHAIFAEYRRQGGDLREVLAAFLDELDGNAAADRASVGNQGADEYANARP